MTKRGAWFDFKSGQEIMLTLGKAFSGREAA